MLIKYQTPNTYITSNIKDLKKFKNNFNDKQFVCKPIFGSQGKGLEILDDKKYMTITALIMYIIYKNF